MTRLSMAFGVLEWRYGYEKSVALTKEAGFEAMDYSLDQMVNDGNILNGEGWREQISEIRRCAENAGLVFNQTHTPFSFSGRLWKDDTSYREIILPRIIRSLEISGMLGVKVAVVHPLHHFLYQGHAEEIFQKNLEFYRMLIPYAREYGIRIGVENMYQVDSRRRYIIDDTCSRIPEFLRYVDEVNDERVVACLDLGHVGLFQQEDEAWDFIRALGHERLQALHVHDNDYRGDQHQIPYIGLMNWNKITQALGEIDYQGDFTYEAGGGFLATMDDEFVPTGLRYMADVGRHLITLIDRARPAQNI